jgi:quercetin dioxygenase-like cupin family protein
LAAARPCLARCRSETTAAAPSLVEATALVARARAATTVDVSEPNALEPEWDVELSVPPFLARAMRLGAHAGARELGATLYEIDPGGTIAPYHVHHGNEELLLVLSGAPQLRTPDGVRELPAGPPWRSRADPRARTA